MVCDRNMALINQKYSAEVVKDLITAFQIARVKPSPFEVIERDPAMFRKWPSYLNPVFVKKYFQLDLYVIYK